VFLMSKRDLLRDLLRSKRDLLSRVLQEFVRVTFKNESQLLCTNFTQLLYTNFTQLLYTNVTFRHLCLLTLRASAPGFWVPGALACLRRPNKCQKRPTLGAKETYYLRTFELWRATAKRRGQQSQKRPTLGAKETYYLRTFELWRATAKRRGQQSQKRPTLGAKETYYLRTFELWRATAKRRGQQSHGEDNGQWRYKFVVASAAGFVGVELKVEALVSHS